MGIEEVDTKEQLVEIMRKDLYGRALRDIKVASVTGEAKMAGFILGACFIDAMAGFRFGIDKNTCKNNVGNRFKCFVTEYMPEYNAETLYTDLRNYLVHSYTEGGSYAFTHKQQDGKHFDIWKGKIILNLEDFILDLEKAFEKLIEKIINEENIFQLAKHRYNEMGLITYVPLEV